MSYRKITLKLDNASSDNIEIVPARTRVTEVFCTKMAAGISIQLVFGQSGDPIDLDNPFSFAPTGDEGNDGLFWRNPVALPGSTLDIWVATGPGGSLGERVDR